MKSLTVKIGALCVAFLLGVVVKTVWDHHKQIQEFLSNIFLYYQD